MMTEETKIQHPEKNHEEESFSAFFYPLVFPFQTKNWWKRLWALPIIAYIPIADFILLRGWRLELVRRMARKEEDVLPPVHSPMHHIKFFKNGIILWLMTALYVGVAFIPLIVMVVYYYSTGYEYGHLAQAVKSSKYVWKKRSKQVV